MNFLDAMKLCIKGKAVFKEFYAGSPIKILYDKDLDLFVQEWNGVRDNWIFKKADINCTGWEEYTEESEL